MHSSTPVSARQRRVATRERIARALCALLAKHSVSQAQLAAWCGVPYQYVSEWCDPDGERSVLFADVVNIEHAELRRDLIAELEPHMMLVERPVVGAEPCDLEHATSLSRASLGLVDSLLLMVQRGQGLTPDEAREARRRIGVLQRDLGALDASLAQTASVPAPVKPLRRTG